MTVIKVLKEGDEALLCMPLRVCSTIPVRETFAKEFLEDRRHHIAVAIDEGTIVGFASGIHYIHPDKSPELWISEVSIAPAHRQRGLGKAVLKAFLEVGRAHSCSTAWVLTYRNNPSDMALYSSLGGLEGADDSGPAIAMIGYRFELR